MEENDVVGGIYRHVKTGGLYVIKEMGIIEATHEFVVIYQSLMESTVWVRPTVEFFDGRFEYQGKINH